MPRATKKTDKQMLQSFCDDLWNDGLRRAMRQAYDLGHKSGAINASLSILVAVDQELGWATKSSRAQNSDQINSLRHIKEDLYRIPGVRAAAARLKRERGAAA